MMLRINPAFFKRFIQSGSIGGIFLLLCVIVSLVIANSGAGAGFNALLGKELGWDSLHLRMPVLSWINDGLMAIFFLLVGLEIKRSLIEGELSSPKRATLPVVAAIGGAVIPAVIYSLINAGTITANGWGIPMATDIAFAIGILSLLGNRVPASLRIFLAALAIADDLIAIIVIAVFYSPQLHLTNLLYAGGIWGVMVLMNRLGVKQLYAYLLPALPLWYLVHHSGIHATIAGVLTAFTIPTTPDSSVSPLEKLEHFLSHPVNFLIMPLFALANTNVHFGSNIEAGLVKPLGLGILAGLIIGKPIGILFSSWLVVQLKLAKLPSKAKWEHIGGIGLLGGIGFTMSIFIALLSFSDESIRSNAKFAVLVASATSAIAGCCWLLFLNRRNKTDAPSPTV
ncbi:MAG: Na+/H+ antiporter NhaA [Niastella sp.]|nr:Na+/H+ antiporter NhaA [Niastella sp.]